jgi:hypothetical protein
MAAYTLRIELLGSPSQDVYKDLHARMERGGFLQTVTGTTSAGKTVTSALPHATYYGSVNATVGAVREWSQPHAKEAWGKKHRFRCRHEYLGAGKNPSLKVKTQELHAADSFLFVFSRR